MTNHVKIHGVVPRIQYTANGTLATFTFPFAIFSTDDVEVYLNDTKQASTAYTVTGVRDSDGGSVTFTSAPANGTIITIVRNLSVERTSDFQEGGALRADTLNDELDYQIACQQQIAENLNRSMVLPPYAVSNDLDLTLPTPSAGKAIVWNSDGTNLENSTVAVNALESTLNGYKTAAQTAASTATTKASVATTQATLAQQAATTATSKATETAAAVEGFSHSISNCVTHIPQDIKLTLNNGVLTLAAGSVLTSPDGTQNTTSQDQTYSNPTVSEGTHVVYVGASTGAIQAFAYRSLLGKAGSGTTLPADNTDYMVFFNTTEGKIYLWNTTSSTWDVWAVALPIAIVTVTNYVITSIDRIFNGGGYLGSSVFLLPNVKGLIAAGRNEDGTLKSISVTNSALFVYQFTNSTTRLIGINMSQNGYSATTSNYNYNYVDNKIYNSGGAQLGFVACCEASALNGSITKFVFAEPMHAVTYQEFSDLKATVNDLQSHPSIYSSAAGYIYFKDGTMLQWGMIPPGTTTITFANPFVNTSYIVSVNAYYDSYSEVAYYGKTTTGCSLYPNRNDYNVTYIAIGKWK